MSAARSTSKFGSSRLAAAVVRYWLAALRYEEALMTRPRVRRFSEPRSAEPNVKQPVGGQNYAKLRFEECGGLLVNREGEALVSWSGEWCAAFEDWLVKRYRRGEDDELGVGHLVLFPALHLPREELAGLLRFAVEVEFRCGDRRFVPPTPAERRRGSFPGPPDGARLRAKRQSDEDALPMSVDVRVLRDVLRINSESIDALFAKLRREPLPSAREMVIAVGQLIAQEMSVEATSASTGHAVPDEPALLLRWLVSVANARLEQVSAQARCYPVALMVNSELAKTTWHLQRDLEVLSERIESGALKATAPAWAYLTREATPARRGVCMGRFRGGALSEGQRNAAERALGSGLSAVQGPPGTGKTTLILNLMAHMLVEKIATLAKTGKMGAEIAVVTSTNNRAVDNVVDPLAKELPAGELALALRVGSRQIIETVTSQELAGVRSYLERQQDPVQASELLKLELEQFSRLRERVVAIHEPHLRHEEQERRAQVLRSELADLATPGAESEAPTLAGALQKLSPNSEPEILSQAIEALADASRSAELRQVLRKLIKRLEKLSELTEKETPAALARAERHFHATEREHLPKLELLLGFEVPSGLPPSADHEMSLEDQLEAWEEATETFLARLVSLQEALTEQGARGNEERDRKRLQEELERLTRELADAPLALSEAERVELSALQLELFESAVRARSLWARAHRDELLRAIEQTLAAIRETRSLRAVLDRRDGAGDFLRQLFPAWGCTLLSLANGFAPELGSVALCVVDEAGQCHPAYAASALLRGKRALVIGDTHQLEPVVGLTADDERRLLRSLDLPAEVRDALGPYRVHDKLCNSAQALADRAVFERPTLVDHYRCQPEIAGICEALCGYGLRVHTPRRTRSDLVPELKSAVLHVAVDGEQERFAGSWMNAAEAVVLADWLERCLRGGIAAEDIGVITPYRGQLERLFRVLRDRGIPLEKPAHDGDPTLELFSGSHSGVALGTVHRFQGGERSVILLSMTVTEKTSLPFVDDRVNLINVAASRAREHLLTFGHTATLRAGKHTRCLVDAPFLESSPLTSLLSSLPVRNHPF